MYERLVDFFVEYLDLNEGTVILEAGCGRGQLTIPLAKKIKAALREFRIIGFDISIGPYEGALHVLRKTLEREELDGFISQVEGDVNDMKEISDRSVDILISNELFCDLGREGLGKALNEFYRILKPGGQMIHGNLNPVPENAAQDLLIKADSHSLETLTSEYEWFSPTADAVVTLMEDIGFRDITVKYFDTNVHLTFNDAVRQLQMWNVDSSYIEKYSSDLKKHGIEFPKEHLIFCKK